MSVEAISAVMSLRGLTSAEHRLLIIFAWVHRGRTRIVSCCLDDDRYGQPGLLARSEPSEQSIYRIIAALGADGRPGGPLLRRAKEAHRGRCTEFELLFLPTKPIADESPTAEKASRPREPFELERRSKGSQKPLAHESPQLPQGTQEVPLGSSNAGTVAADDINIDIGGRVKISEENLDRQHAETKRLWEETKQRLERRASQVDLHPGQRSRRQQHTHTDNSSTDEGPQQ